MDDLFTFNSHQFQAATAPTPQPHHIRKRIISTVDSKRNPSLYSLSTTSEHRHSNPKLSANPKHVAFHRPLPSDHANIPTEESITNRDKSFENSSKRYLMELQNKQSLDLEESSCSRRKEKMEKEISSLEGESGRRK
jgi:hypothetical protein